MSKAETRTNGEDNRVGVKIGNETFIEGCRRLQKAMSREIEYCDFDFDRKFFLLDTGGGRHQAKRGGR